MEANLAWTNMVGGKLYMASDPYLQALQREAHGVCRAYNRSGGASREALLALFAAVGEGCYIEPDFFCDYGRNITIGTHFYANTGLVILDTCPVTIGDHVLVGPQVGIYTATHPLDWRVRRQGPEYGKPVVIGSDVWIGGHAVINPGVTIGDRAVVASGAVVTRDVPPDTVVGGNPAKMIKRLVEAHEGESSPV